MLPVFLVPSELQGRCFLDSGSPTLTRSNLKPVESGYLNGVERARSTLTAPNSPESLGTGLRRFSRTWIIQRSLRAIQQVCLAFECENVQFLVIMCLSEDEFSKQLEILKSLTNDRSQPNLNALWKIAKDLEFIKLNLKFFGYDLANSLAEALPPRPDSGPRTVGLKSKPSTQSDIESDWVGHRCYDSKSRALYIVSFGSFRMRYRPFLRMGVYAQALGVSASVAEPSPCRATLRLKV